MKREPSNNSWTNFLIPLSLVFGLFLLLSLDTEQVDKTAVPENPIETWVNPIVAYLAAGAEIAAALVIGFGIFQSIFVYASALFSRSKRGSDLTESIRLRLGRVLVLGLEFTVAADILRTVVAPTRPDILNLAAIVFLRTLLNYFLEQEIRQVEERHQVDRGQSESN